MNPFNEVVVLGDVSDVTKMGEAGTVTDPQTTRTFDNVIQSYNP